ncbi:hypothetical protein TW78_02555 [Vibrio coralliilyticus]|uniref:Uncharacterized protein n=1 Tax=Vibrio coralliilyticus TaxID=190893 RepID=A0A837G330_9VIBR|nr:hypothetical protein [Vibrio coralliilyticus]KJY78453.1 hypothetical protein TW78_02555 [Vibrio coralliilyticus]QOU29780.1 hypothetical protein TW71_014625 [Vibrio coralliilyticus]
MKNKIRNDDLDIEQLADSQVWQDTKKIYYDNKSEFDDLILKFAKNYKIDKKTSRDAFIYEIMSCQYNKKNNNKIFDKNVVKWFFVYIVSFIFVAISGSISLLIALFCSRKETEIVYEEMWTGNSLSKRFYNYIDKNLSTINMKRMVLLISPGIDFSNDPIEGWKGKVVNRRYASIIFSFGTAFKVLHKDLLFSIRLLIMSSRSGINITYIYLRVLRKMLMYNSQVHNVKSKILISAGDYYWTPLKYHAYKRNIDNIILLQHNYINDYLHHRLFQYCDYYYSHSQQSIDKHALCGNAKFFNVGSFQLIPFINENITEYDIVFISQTVYQNLVSSWKDLDQDKLKRSYHKLVDNFKCYLQNNPNLKAVYISKLGHEVMQPTIGDKALFDKLDNIDFVSTSGKDTFELISKSKVVINMYSSVGFESYGLNKKVLWINYDRCCDLFNCDTENEDIHVMISDAGYSAFEDRVNLLLSSDGKIDNHFRKLKEKYMNMKDNPAELVSNRVKLIIEDSY